MFNEDANIGFEHGSELFAFSNAVLGDDVEALNQARDTLQAAMGPEAVVAASIIAGNFSMVDRAANAIGISVEPMVLKPSEDFRAEYKINDFPSAKNSLG